MPFKSPYYHPHGTYEETEAKESERTSPRSHSLQAIKVGLVHFCLTSFPFYSEFLLCFLLRGITHSSGQYRVFLFLSGKSLGILNKEKGIEHYLTQPSAKGI